MSGPFGVAQSRRTISNSAVPSGVPSSGSVAANGALTLGTALPTAFIAGIWLYFPSGAVYAGSAAGLYWVVMSSTTVGTVFDNVYTVGPRTPPSSPTPIVAAGPGAYVQTTGLTVSLSTITLPGGALGSKGKLTGEILWGCSNSAGSKIAKSRYGGADILAQTLTTQGSLHTIPMCLVTSPTSLITGSPVPNGIGVPSTYGSFLGIIAVDSSINQSVDSTGNIAVATDYILLAADTWEIIL